MSSYNWQDLRGNHLEVEWGENEIRKTRRIRALGGQHPQIQEKQSNWVSVAIVVMSTLGSVFIFALVATALVNSPIQKREGPAKMAEGMDSISSLEVSISVGPSSNPVLSPTMSPTSVDSQQPSIETSAHPSIASSEYPSTSPTLTSSMIPSAIPKAPPAPAPAKKCIDKAGVYYNHAGDKVSCDWFQTVGTYNYHKNCDKTDLGKACLFSCREYNNCILVTAPPTSPPSIAPTSAAPSDSPTPEPPKSLSFKAVADATVKEEEPTATLGTSSWLKVEESPSDSDISIANRVSRIQNGEPGQFHVLLRFHMDKHDSTRPIKSAELRLKAANSCSSGGYLQRTESHQWEEETVNWQTAPKGDGVEVGRLGIIRSGFWYSVDVTKALTKHSEHKTLSVRLFPGSTDECMYFSKDNKDGGGPELHIEYDDV